MHESQEDREGVGRWRRGKGDGKAMREAKGKEGKGKERKGEEKERKKIAEWSRTILDQAMGLTNYRCSTAKRWTLNIHALFVHIHC
jgi:hypothetical protein